ncbi:MAG: TonB-dependent receptor [Caulobacteraceae bacterium]|nr:TonB-dependent receptor [Caulobacteraceae bacterium]
MGRVGILFGMTAVGALLSAEPALSATPRGNPDAQREFRIPSQSLDTALLLYSRQSGLQVISSAAVVEHKVAPALRGRKTSRQALKELLEGSNLSFVASGGTVTIVPASAAASETRSDELDTVTVTGSRIVRDGYSAPTPVTVAPVAELLETTPTNIADALNKLPQFSVQFTPQSNTNASAPSGNYLNLYGLGQGRTLVMMDGVRVPGTSTTGSVDVNTLPQALVQRVEIVTGGASAVYGSDAIGGVVNYILNTNFNGFKGLAQTGISTYGDAPSQKFNLAFGTQVLGKGHFEVSYEHSQSAAVNQGDRSYTNNSPGYSGLGTAASPYVLGANLRMSTTTAGGYVSAASGATPAQTAALTAALVNKQFVGGGTLAPFNAGALTGSLPSTTNTGGLQVGGDGAYLTGMQLLKPVNTDNIFTRFDYDLGHSITAYAQVAAGLSQTNYFVAPTAVTTTTVLSGNPYLPASAQAALTAASAAGKPASFTMSSLPQNLTQMQRTNQWDSDISATVGLKGKVFNQYNWNVAYTHGQGLTHVETDNNINTSHFYAALDAVAGPNGSPVCYVSTTSNANLYPGCVPLNFIGQGNESAAALNYIMQNTAYTILNKIDDVSASISGSPFDNWAGPVAMAANVETRWASLAETTDAPPGTPQLTGLRPTWVAGLRGAMPSTLFVNNTVAPQYGANSVWEVGAETAVPLLKDFPLAKYVEFSGALRYTQYSVSGPAITWKAGLNYQPFNDLRFRITESRDIRAPNLFELFQSQTVTQTTITNDPLTGQTYTVNQYAQGDPKVKPEVATSNTLGLVYSPSWLPRFRMSADYYLITINGVISNSLPIGAGATTAINTCLTSGGTSAYCQAVPRPLPLTNSTPANNITAIYSFPINLSEQFVRGLAVQASYGFNMADIQAKLVGQTDLRLSVNYEPQNVTVTNPGQPGTNQAGGSTARARLSGTFNYSLGPFKVNWQTSYTGPHHPGSVSNTPTFFVDTIVPAVITHDLGFSYRFQAHGQNLQAFLTITNLFNQMPALGPPTPTAIPGAQTPLGPGAISPLGRYYTAGVRFGF